MISTESQNVFVSDSDIEWQQMAPGVKRKIMAYDDKLMVVKVAFETGGIGTLHQHVHTQITHVESGVFEIEVEGEKQVLKAGDAFFIPPNQLHGAKCLEAGILIDCFSPAREDFLATKK